MTTALAFSLAALCFLLPFVTAGCEERTTARGIDFVTGHEPLTYDETGAVVEPERTGDDDDIPETLIREGAPAAMLAFAFVVGAAALSLLPGATSAAASLLAGVLALGAFLLFLLGLELRAEGVFADLRSGFWLAAVLTGAGTVLAGRRWTGASPPLPQPRVGARLVGMGAVLLALAVIVPHMYSGQGDEGEPSSIAYFFLWSLSPGSRATGWWGVAALVVLVYLVALTSLVLARSSAPVCAGAAAAGLGLAGVLLALEAVGHIAALDGIDVGDGLWIQLAAGGLALAGGLISARRPDEEAVVVPALSRALAVAGALLVGVAILLPYERLPNDVLDRSLLGLDIESDRWFAVAPLGLAVATVAASFVLSRQRASGALLGLGAGLAVTFLPLLYPAIEREGEFVGALGPAGIVGLVAAALVVLAGVLALERERDLLARAPTAAETAMR